MPAKTTSDYAQNLLSLIFNSVTYQGIATCAASGINTLYVGLHTSSAGLPSGSSQLTNEAAYGGYSRVAVARNASAWTVTTNSVSPASNVNFGAGVSGGETVTYFAVGTSAVGVGHMLYFGSVQPTVQTGNGISPVLTTATAISET